jgi:CheY-like chemotaxis protein
MGRQGPQHSPTRPLVLLVEGHEDTRAMYALSLSAMGFDVVSTEDTTEAYRCAWDSPPDIIVIDVPTPNDGDSQLAHDLKQNPRTRDIPLVAVSGYLHPSLRDRIDREGFAAFFPKPCLPDELATGLRQVLDGDSRAHVDR